MANRCYYNNRKKDWEVVMTPLSYKTVFCEGCGEIVEKKSRFIAHVYPVTVVEEAEEIINRLKKEYWDARHNCYAYIIGKDGMNKKCSDDGEPQGTAGKPMLEVLTGEGLVNVLVVVTRYFGGVLLGTGGLIRAYQGVVKEGLKESEVIEKKYAEKVTVSVDYTFMGKIQYIAASLDVITNDIIYDDKVNFSFVVLPDKMKPLNDKIMEATSATATTVVEKEVWIGVSDSGNIHIFEDEV